MKWLWLFVGLLSLLTPPARAAEADVYCLTGTSSTGFPIFQPASPTQPCPVTATGNLGGFDSGSFPAQTATPANSSHSAGQSLGGLFSVPVARINGGSGIITNLTWISTGGATVQLMFRLWDKNPANTTCTDNTAFVESATDDQHLIATPFTITPQPPANTTGDTNTYATLTNLTFDYHNQDGTASKNVYACVVLTGTDSVDDNKAVYLNLMGPQN